MVKVVLLFSLFSGFHFQILKLPVRRKNVTPVFIKISWYLQDILYCLFSLDIIFSRKDNLFHSLCWFQRIWVETSNALIGVSMLSVFCHEINLPDKKFRCVFSCWTSSADGRRFFSVDSVGFKLCSLRSSPFRPSAMSRSFGRSFTVVDIVVSETVEILWTKCIEKYVTISHHVMPRDNTAHVHGWHKHV